MSDGSSTLDVPESDDEERVGPLVMALVIAWAAGEPDRAGEVALLEADDAPCILGRGRDPDAAAQTASRRIAFVRQRPAAVTPRPPLSARGLSREQLRLVAGDDRIVVENVGRCPMSTGGAPVQRCTLRPGDTLLLRNQLLLFCTRRPREMRLLRDFPASSVGPFGEADALGIVGESPAVWRLRDRIAWTAKAGRHTLILGESGTGKELAARALHTLSPLGGRRFVARSAATLPAGLVDAELFGNVKGYPNPGMPERPGLIGEADGGTLFLDEIGELPPGLHANLLRVLDGGEYHRLGGSSARRADLRLIAATNRAPGALKHDLLARLTLRFTMPSLAERREDLPLLARHLLRAALTHSPEITRRFVAEGGDRPELRVAPELIEHLLHRPLDANVRELDSVLWRAMSVSAGDTIRSIHDSMQAAVQPPPPPPPQAFTLGETPNPPPQAFTLGETPDHSPQAPIENSLDSEPTPPYEEPSPERIRACLAEHGGNVSRAARALDLPSRYVLYRLIRKHGIEVDEARGGG